MRRLPTTLTVVLLLAASFGVADVLNFTDGGGTKGNVEEITFLYKDLHKMVERDDVKSLTVGSDGVDTLVVQSGKRYVGKLIAVRFRSSNRVSVVGRGKVKSLTIDGSWKPQEPSEDSGGTGETEKPEEMTDAEKEKKDALKRNQDLGDACLRKARELENEEKKAVSARYDDDKEQIEDDVKRLLRSIDRKMRLRREGKAYRNDRGEYNDGIERDYRDIAKAKSKRKALLAKIKKEQEGVEEKAAERVKRIKVAWSGHRRAIAEGEPPDDEQMIANYKKALGTTGSDKKK